MTELTFADFDYSFIWNVFSSPHRRSGNGTATSAPRSERIWYERDFDRITLIVL